MKIFLTGGFLPLFFTFFYLSSFAQQNSKGECMNPDARVVQSTTQGLEFRVEIPCIEFYQVKTPDGTFQRIKTNPRYQLFGKSHFSKPEIISYTTLIALPIGSTPGNITIKPSGERQQRNNIRLYPVQRDETTPEGQERKPVFEFDQQIYNRFSNDLTKISGIRAVQQVEANIYRITVDLVSYLPSERQLTWFNGYDIRIQYKDPNDCFRKVARPTGQFKFELDPVDKLQARQRISVLPSVLNAEDLLKKPCPGQFTPVIFGCDLLVITHPDFMAPCLDLDAHKEARGVRTVVISTQTVSDKYGDGSGNVTDEEVKEYIKWYHSSSLIKPRWLLLVGDSEFIPIHYNMDIVLSKSIAAGDQYYGQLNDDDLEIPAMGIGRFPVDTESEAQVIVDKIIAYESSPPTGIRDEYSFAVQFQDDDDDGTADREFTETAEYIRDFVIGEGVNVERIYKNKSSADPLYYDDGSDIPADLLKPGFAWDGDEVDIYTAINNGRLIVFHRDHGSKNGWSTPPFKRDDIDDVFISDTKYPLIFSINCSSGLFDNETINDPPYYVAPGHTSDPSETYFSEKFLRQADGAIGVICDGRASGTGMNNKMSKGLFDAYFPGLESYGGSSKITTLGDVLNHAKGYVLANTVDMWDIEKENTIYNLLGDPSLSVNGGKVYKFIRVTGIIPNFATDYVLITLNFSGPRGPLKPIKGKGQARLGSIPVIIQDQETGEVIGRAVTNKEGLAKVKIAKGYKGEMKVTASGLNMGMYSEVIKR